ncbi:MAG: glycoside hydrolase family 38 C-terminal domain-containing protein [Phycisphaerae bacterium]|nr:glycoside hydrolase family 38 C-terminal domain-containing protein [Phycisphaerae bacterium]
MSQIIGRIRQELDLVTSDNRACVERLLAEVEFAEGLADLLHKRDWPTLIERAGRLVADALAGGDVPAAVARAEAMLAPIGKIAKTYTIHCVGHAHIDMNWMWSWPETVAVTNDTFLTVLRLMEEFDDFTFTQSQASVYQIVAEHHPELLERIRRRVAQGRWEVAAATWVEGDKNLAGGEALARHLLYTRRYMQELLGLGAADLPVEWSPDTFGHAWTIPSISSRGGVRCYYMCRGGKLIDKPPVFWWQGPDGSRILVDLESTWYNDHIGPHNAAAMLKFCGKTGLRDWMNVYGVGDHGGGPTRRDIVRAREMNGWPIYPNFRFATAKACFERLLAAGDRWPVITDELNLEFSGCYTTQTQIKRHNRRAESELVVAESAAVVSLAALGRAYPADALHRGWTNTLFGHFHDILPGSGVRATREYQSGLFQQTTAATGAIKADSLRALAAAIGTAALAASPAPASPESIAVGAGVGFGANAERMSAANLGVVDGPRPFVVFNPAGWSRDEVVTLTVWDSPHERDRKRPRFVVRQADGNTTPAQVTNKGGYWGHEFVELVAPVHVGPLGYAALAVEPGECPGPRQPVKLVKHDLLHAGESSPAFTLENEFTLAQFDRATGGICKLVDKATGVDLARPDDPLGLLEYVLERPGGMSAWVIAEPLRVVSLPVESLAEGKSGPHLASVVAKMKLNDSTFTVTYSLKAGEPGVGISIVANWLERGGPAIGTPTLRMKFPTSLARAVGRYEIPFGSIERKLTTGVEVPALRWAEVVGKAASLALLNDSKHGHALDGATLRITLIRSSYEPDPLPEIGEHQIQLTVLPRGGKGSVADLVRRGAALNQPMQIVPTDLHRARLPLAASGVTVSPAGVILAAVKKAEDANALVFRLQSTEGRAVTARLTLNEKLLPVAGSPVEVDLLERSLPRSSAKAAKGGFTVRIPAHGIASVRIALKKR